MKIVGKRHVNVNGFNYVVKTRPYLLTVCELQLITVLQRTG